MAYPSTLTPTLKSDWADTTPVKTTHPLEHNEVALDVEALKAKVGVNSSAVNTTVDFKLSGVATGDKAVSKTGTETLTNKTLTGPSITTPTITVPVIADFSSANHNHQNSAGGGTLAEAALATTDVTTNDVTSTKHGFAPKSPADATKFLNGAATPAYAAVKDSDLSTTDITTNDVTTSKHGFVPKAPNDTSKYLRGDATWGTVSTLGDWQQLGETILGSDTISISVAGFSGRKDLRIVIHIVGSSGSDGSSTIQFNGDSGSNYGYRVISNVTLNAAKNAQSSFEPVDNGGTGNNPFFMEIIADNNATGLRKFGTHTVVEVNGTGSTAPSTQYRGVWVWNNTSAQITTVTLTRSAGLYLTGTRITVYGKKD